VKKKRQGVDGLSSHKSFEVSLFILAFKLTHVLFIILNEILHEC